MAQSADEELPSDPGIGGHPLPSMPTVPLQACPIATTLGSLGRKWTLPILRDIAFFPEVSFSSILKGNAGLGPRTLSLRLRQLVGDGLIVKEKNTADPRHPTYRLTEKGLEVWPILASLFQFGIRNYPSVVFADGKARSLEEVYPNDADLMLGPLATFARSASPRPESPAVARTAAAPASERPRR
ncbi:MAG TPA: helix-turn-helix domain-containing protein [Thermoplasmata archaeon]|nr:helix-turn-helix domain-containing protein [Thermoplasmata archaeon]